MQSTSTSKSNLQYLSQFLPQLMGTNIWFDLNMGGNKSSKVVVFDHISYIQFG